MPAAFPSTSGFLLHFSGPTFLQCLVTSEDVIDQLESLSLLLSQWECNKTGTQGLA